MKLLYACCVLSAVVIGSATVAQAHDPGLSVLELQPAGSRLAARLTFARSDIEKMAAFDGKVVGQIELVERTRLEAIASDFLEVRSDARRILPDRVDVTWDDSGAVHLVLSFAVEGGARLRVQSAILARLPRGHRQYVVIRNELGTTLSELMLDASGNAVEINVDGPAAVSARRPFRDFLILGVEHILTGYDHLVFLLGVLIAGASFKASARIITSFTIAHSLTLALATLDVVRISPAIVEPLIAASIVYVGIENVFRRDLRWRWLLTFGFGLVHGFGFASVLRDMGIGSGNASAAVPLVSFNLGVELGQIAIATVALPLIWRLRTRPAFVLRYVPACSVLIAIAGSVWLIERVLSK